MPHLRGFRQSKTNQPAKLQRLARILKFCMKQVKILYMYFSISGK